MNTITIERVDELPERKIRESKRAEFVAALRTNPGRWAKYPGNSGPGFSRAEQAKLGLETAMRGGVHYVRVVR